MSQISGTGNGQPNPIRITQSALVASVPPDRMRSECVLATFYLVGFSVLVFFLTGVIALMDWQSQSMALRAEGVVLELLDTSSPIAQVRYTDATGVERIANTSGPLNGVDAVVGERIPILYHASSPEYAMHDDPIRAGLMMAWFVGFGCLPLLPIPFLWRQVRRQTQRFDRLRRLAYKREVESVHTQSFHMARGRDRWAVVAHWRDSLGRLQHTVAGPYTFDPAPIDPATVTVLADPYAPEQSLIAPETLPATTPGWLVELRKVRAARSRAT
ncbi:MAG: hypothetical protein KDI69_09995 [Xanthomonadales bacterium]|nr:hypothetical protein [Xanthomonadales bacterium]